MPSWGVRKSNPSRVFPSRIKVKNCFASFFASMPAVKYSQEFTISIVVGKDVVPRIGLHQMESLRADLINAIKRSKDPKVRFIYCSNESYSISFAPLTSGNWHVLVLILVEDNSRRDGVLLQPGNDRSRWQSEQLGGRSRLGSGSCRKPFISLSSPASKFTFKFSPTLSNYRLWCFPLVVIKLHAAGFLAKSNILKIVFFNLKNRVCLQVSEADREAAREDVTHPTDSSIALTVHQPLYPPGKILHVVRHHPTKGEWVCICIFTLAIYFIESLSLYADLDFVILCCYQKALMIWSLFKLLILNCWKLLLKLTLYII